MPLSGICTYTDVIARMADVSMATASDDDAVNAEIIDRKILQAEDELTLDLTKKIQKIIAPYQTDAYNHTPAEIVDLITDEAKLFLNKCGVLYTISAVYEEGVNRLKFPGQDGEAESKSLKDTAKYWKDLACKEFESICPLLTFNQDGSSTVTLLKRLLMQQTSSVRVTF